MERSRSPVLPATLSVPLLLIAGAVVFAAAFPNPVFRFGLFPLAFVAVMPVALAIRRMPLWATPVAGAVYGFLAYALFNYWLANFHPLAILIVPVIYAGYFLVVFPALWLADRAFGRFAFLAQTLIWLAYEYLRTTGFLGYAYGITGYAVWPLPVLFQIADIGGVWLVSALVVLPGFFLAQIWNDHVPHPLTLPSRAVWRYRLPEIVTYGLLVAATLAYGVASPVDYSAARHWRVALVQQNIDPWVGGQVAYERSLEILTRESRRALVEFDPEAVIWSETSFVPSIDFHTRYRQDIERFELVRELTTFLSEQRVPYVIGNGDGQLVRNAAGELERVDYNAVLVFEPGGRLQDTYRKIHLVPFTEHFPYERHLPWLYNLLIANNTTFWLAGEEWTVFELDGIRFSTPICFEDTFGYLSRGFVRRGADVIVNLTNDRWSHSEAAAMQHMAMATFRAVENRRSVVRSTNGGMTTIIDPNGSLIDLYPAFREGYLGGEVPVFTGRTTLYTRFGDWAAYLFTVTAAVATFAAFAILVARRVRGS